MSQRHNGVDGRFARVVCRGALGIALAVAVAASNGVSKFNPTSPGNASQLFDPRHVWNIQLSLTTAAWDAMQPHYGTKPSVATSWSRYLGPEGGRNGVAAHRGIEVDYVHADLILNGRRFKDVGLRYKGQGTLMRSRGEKRPLKVQFNRYDKNQRLAGIATVNLQNSVTDSSWMNEALAYRLYRDAGVPAPRTGYARVSVSINGAAPTQLGLYTVLEDYEPTFFDGRTAPAGGALFKPSLQTPFEFLGEDWSVYNQSYDPKTALSEEQKRRLIEFSRLVSTASDEQFAEQLGDYLDIDEFARYFAVVGWMANIDSLLDRGQNYYVYMRPTDQRLMFLPWDQDGSFGNFGRNWGGGAESMDIVMPWRPGIRFLDRVMAVPKMRAAYDHYLNEFSATLFLPERFQRQIDELAPAIRPVVVEESESLAQAFELAAQGQAGIVPFVKARSEFVGRQLASRPNLMR